MRNTEEYLDSVRSSRIDKGLVYDYSKVNYVGANRRIIIICQIHGEFFQFAGDHTSGRGCRKCGTIAAKKTSLIKYGVDNPSKSPVIKEKIKQVFIKKFGVDNPSKNKKIKQQKKETCLKNFGVPHPGQNLLIQQQKKKTNLAKYGVEYPMQSKAVSAKAVATKVANGGFTKSNSSREATLYIRQYIVDNKLQLDQCAYADAENSLHEWGIYINGRWTLFDLVVFDLGYRGNKDHIIEILEYHGPFHYTAEDKIFRGTEKAYPWKSNKTTIEESVDRDLEKDVIARGLTDNFKVVWARDIADNVSKLESRYPGGKFDAWSSDNRAEGDI